LTLKYAIPWPRVFAEGAIIVVSILLAFAIDAAWESRQAARWRQETLADLGVEARANTEAIRDFIALYEAAVEAAERVYSSQGSLEGLPSDSLARVFLLSVFVPTFDPDDAALMALVRSGQLDRIEDRELRRSIARLMDLAEDLAENRRDSEFTRDQVAHALFERRLSGEFDALFAPAGRGATDQVGLLDGVEVAAAGGLSPGLTGLLSDPEFGELVAHRAMWSRVMISEFRRLEHALQETMSRLESSGPPEM
jgi:hypothetical protein